MQRGARIYLKGWQQAAVAAGSALGALMDPRRADLIAALGETTGRPAFESVLERMRKNPEGRVCPISSLSYYCAMEAGCSSLSLSMQRRGASFAGISRM